MGANSISEIEFLVKGKSNDLAICTLFAAGAVRHLAQLPFVEISDHSPPSRRRVLFSLPLPLGPFNPILSLILLPARLLSQS